MSVVANITVTDRGVSAAIRVEDGAALALLGPNGAGKSTVLEAIAGIIRPDAGETSIGGVTVCDASAGSWLPARERGVALVTQGSDLFPTMSVAENVAFGPRARGASKRDGLRVAEEWLDRVGAGPLSTRRAHELSGGQARRVAIARALASSPSVLLLDEPFAGLDLEAATGIRALVADIIPGTTTILTTHNALDAYALADQVAILENGVVVDSGPTVATLARPRTAFSARMGARVLVTGTLDSGSLVLDGGERVPASAGAIPNGTAVAIALRPGQVRLAAERQADPGYTWVRDVIAAVEPHADVVRVHGARVAADVDPSDAARLRAGALVWFGVPHGADAYVP